MRFEWTRIGEGSAVTGAAVDKRTLVTWGEQIQWLPLAGSRAQTLQVEVAGACLMDVNRDGRMDVVANERSGALVWYEAPAWKRHEIDSGIDAPDLMPATIGGRRGVVIIQKRIKVRFYEVPADAAARWAERDLYSIYTPSWQGGLAAADVDGDGLVDILCGNYWMRAPQTAGLPWRLFAINTWTQEEPSGMMRVVPVRRGMATAQRLLAAGRVAYFEKPSDPRVLWTQHDLGTFDRPDSLEAADLDGDGAADLIVAERGAAGRVVMFAGPGLAPRELRKGRPVMALRVAGRADLVIVTEKSIEYGRNVTARSR